MVYYPVALWGREFPPKVIPALIPSKRRVVFSTPESSIVSPPLSHDAELLNPGESHLVDHAHEQPDVRFLV